MAALDPPGAGGESIGAAVHEAVVPVARPRTEGNACRPAAKPPSFVCGPLPRHDGAGGERGTGKTHAIGALVTRYVAEGVAALDKLLVVTFGRAASQELRERVRGHLVRGRTGAGRPGGGPSGKDPIHVLLADAPDDEVGRRRGLRAGLAGFDAATIVTTHQFCQYVLTGLGIAGDGDADVELVETLDDLIVEVVDDLYVRAFAGALPPTRSSTGTPH